MRKPQRARFLELPPFKFRDGPVIHIPSDPPSKREIRSAELAIERYRIENSRPRRGRPAKPRFRPGPISLSLIMQYVESLPRAGAVGRRPGSSYIPDERAQEIAERLSAAKSIGQRVNARTILTSLAAEHHPNLSADELAQLVRRQQYALARARKRLKEKLPR